MNETCRLCGGSFTRFKGYVIVPTPWGIKHQHKPGDCPDAPVFCDRHPGNQLCSKSYNHAGECK